MGDPVVKTYRIRIALLAVGEQVASPAVADLADGRRVPVKQQP
jgi:hypothetical protein